MNWLPLMIILFNFKLLNGQNSLGLEFSIGTSNIVKHTSFEERYKKSSGLSITVYSIVKIKNRINVKFGLEVEKRECKVNGLYYAILGDFPNYYLGLDTISRNRFNEMGYLTLPFIFQSDFKILDKLNLQIGIGGYYSYLINQIWSYKYDGGRFKYDNYGPLSPIDNPYNDKYIKFDAGYILQFGVTYSINKYFITTVNATWKKGLINIIDSDQTMAFNESKYYGIGIAYLMK